MTLIYTTNSIMYIWEKIVPLIEILDQNQDCFKIGSGSQPSRFDFLLLALYLWTWGWGFRIALEWDMVLDIGH